MEAALYERNDERQEKEKLMQLVGFVIGKETFGVDILMVQEIIREVQITAIPDSPDFIEGVINLRGNIIPIIDLRKRLNLFKDKSIDGATWIVIINVGGRVTGFIVDAVTKVLKVSANSINHPPDLVVAGLKSQYIDGVCKIESGLLILLNFSRILLVDEIKKLREINKI